MQHLRRYAALTVLVCGLVAGCGSADASSAPAPPQQQEPPPPGTVALTGDLRAPGELTTASLAKQPQHTVRVSYGSSKGTQAHTETGVLLADALPATAFAEAPGKNPALSFGVLGVGADGYTALVAYGEYSADFAGRPVMIATSEDGKPLARPRLVLPGDKKGGRYVSDLVELKAVRVGR